MTQDVIYVTSLGRRYRYPDSESLSFKNIHCCLIYYRYDCKCSVTEDVIGLVVRSQAYGSRTRESPGPSIDFPLVDCERRCLS